MDKSLNDGKNKDDSVQLFIITSILFRKCRICSFSHIYHMEYRYIFKKPSFMVSWYLRRKLLSIHSRDRVIQCLQERHQHQALLLTMYSGEKDPEATLQDRWRDACDYNDKKKKAWINKGKNSNRSTHCTKI